MLRKRIINLGIIYMTRQALSGACLIAILSFLCFVVYPMRVNGMTHTNGIESFWATLKRGYKGTYHHMSKKHLSRYITEFAGRYNVRDHDTLVQMEMLAKGFTGKRLRYKDLIA